MFKFLLKAGALLVCLMAALWGFFTVLGVIQLTAFVTNLPCVDRAMNTVWRRRSS